MDKMKKLMEAKKKSKLSPVEKDAKESVLRGLSDDMAGLMKKKLGGMKKATIMADSPEGMKKGAELVQKIAGSLPDGEESSEEKPGMKDAAEHEEEMVAEAEHDGQEEEKEEAEEKSKEELLAEIERLKAKIEKLS